MNNETIMFLTKLCERLNKSADEAWSYDDHGSTSRAISAVSQTIEDLMREEAPEHTCERKPWDWDRKQQSSEKIAHAMPWSDTFIAAWRGTDWQ